MDLPVLIFGSSLTALGVLRSLGRTGIAAYSICRPGELATKSRWYRAAPNTDGRIPSPEELPEYLASLAIPGAVLMACSDDWTKAIAGLPASLRERFPASIASASAIEALTDKWRFAQMLQIADVPRPTTLLIQSVQELAALPESCFENMFLKPLDSQGFSFRTGVKAFQLKSRSHALEVIASVLRSGDIGFPILLQEFIPGPADKYILVDGFVDRNGKTRGLFARRRLRMHPAPFGNSTLSETIPLSEAGPAVETLERIWSTLGYRGIFDAEFKYDNRDQQYKIIEVNARPWWFVEFATRCGIDVCDMAYRDAQGLPVNDVANYPAGRRCVYLFPDFAAHRALDPGVRGFLRWIGSLKGVEEIIYCRDDPGPGIALAARLFQRLVASLFGEAPSSLPSPPSVPPLSWRQKKSALEHERTWKPNHRTNL
jgi:D-aspartate ligase